MSILVMLAGSVKLMAFLPASSASWRLHAMSASIMSVFYTLLEPLALAEADVFEHYLHYLNSEHAVHGSCSAEDH